MTGQRSSRALLALAVSFVTLTSTARAGTYEVAACDSAVGGGANSSFVQYTDPGMAAYPDCRTSGEGLVARSVFDNGTAPNGARAAMIFDAPPGTAVTGVTFDGAIERADCGYSTILAAGGQDFGGRAVWGYGAGTSCSGPYAVAQTVFNYPNQRVDFVANRVRLETQCVAASCRRSGRSGIRLIRVRVRVSDDVAPGIGNARGGLWTRDGWIGGEQSIGLTGSDNAGVRELRVLADGRPLAVQALVCDATQRVPCPGSADLERSLASSAIGADGRHQLRLVVVDTAGNESSVARDVAIDNTAPDAPEALAVAGGDGWRSTNAFGISWKNPPQQHAPVAAAEYELCRTSGEDCVVRSQDGADITQIAGLKVPEAGEWRLKLWLRDAAGNRDRRLVAPPATLRFDDTSPEPRLQRLSPENPTELVVDTTDTGSGLASGTVELRRAGSQLWRPQQVRVDGNRLIAVIADERLRNGAYDVRASAADQAGNARATQTWADGAAAQLSMPIRLKTALRAGIRRGSGKRVRLARAAYVSYGRRVRVRGRLTTPEGNPLQDVTVEAMTDVKGATPEPRLVATVKTSKRGAFSFLVRRGPSRRITIRYGGAAKIRSATRVLQLNVRSRTTIRPNRRRLVNGETVRLRGRIATGRIPRTGKLVEVQVFVRGRWRTFATTRSGRRGTWSYDYRFDGTRGLQRYRFRARIPREFGYPFATGRSPATAVRVRGS